MSFARLVAAVLLIMPVFSRAAEPAPETSAIPHTTQEAVPDNAPQSDLDATPAAEAPLIEDVVADKADPALMGAATARVAWMRQADSNPFALVAYEPNYFIYTYSTNVNHEPYRDANVDYADELKHHEMKFQLSFALPIWRAPLGENTALVATYTQVSMWQMINRAASSPFRETNYEPQIFLGWLPDMNVFGFNIVSAELGFNHQSNGRSDPMSRSWNRIYTNIIAERGNLALQFKPWYRVPEDDDDNPDIEDYMGHFELGAAYRLNEHVFTMHSRYNLSHQHGSVEAGWSMPIGHNVRFYAQVFTGYGETLIDYNHSQTRIGLGVMMNDWL